MLERPRTLEDEMGVRSLTDLIALILPRDHPTIPTRVLDAVAF